MINAWLKQVLFDAWRITNLGQQLFGLSKKAKDSLHLADIKEILLKSKIVLE